MAQGSLYEALARVPDPRQRRGKRHPLQAILTLLVVAMLSGCHSLSAVAQFGRDRPQLARALGFTRRPLCCSALHYFLKRLDGEAFEAVVAQWLGLAAKWPISLDGKTATGSGDGELPALHLLSAYAPQAKAVLRSMPVDAKTNEHKQALQMLDLLPGEGAVVTGDAMFCQRDLSEKVREKGGIICGRSRTTSPSSSRRSPSGLTDQPKRPSRSTSNAGGPPKRTSPRPARRRTAGSSVAA